MGDQTHGRCPRRHGFYKTAAWRRMRAWVLARDCYECQACKRRGLVTKATDVHHIQHLSQRPDLALDPDNLIALCKSCHNAEHPEKLTKQKFENPPELWE